MRKVSLGVPVYNGEAYLEDALKSLVEQDYKELEIVISNNASTDGTGAIIEKFAKEDSRIVVYDQEETIDVASNFTFVLEKSTGDYFCWCAGDDVRSSGSIASLVNVLDEDSDVVCAMTDVKNVCSITGKEWIEELVSIRHPISAEAWKSQQDLFFQVPISNVFFTIYGLFRREVISTLKLQYHLPSMGNTEIPILAQLACRGKIASVDDVGFTYRRHIESVYHAEQSKADRTVGFKSRKAVRSVVRSIVARSELPFSKKASVNSALLRGQFTDLRVNVGFRVEKIFNKMNSQFSRLAPKRVMRSFLRRAGFGLYRLKSGETSYEEVRHQERLFNQRRIEGWVFEQPKRLKMVNDRRIRTLIDCGANRGQYVENLKKEGWNGRVFSFEPLRDEFSDLSGKAAADPDWTAYHFALGEEDASMEINVAGNSYSSSLLDFSSEFTELRPDAKPTETQIIKVRSLDEVVATESLEMEGPVMMKLDVQGFELSVLRGAREFLRGVSILQCELALIPSYEGAPTFHETKTFLEEHGFVLAHLIDGHANHLTGELREVDGIFLNTKLSPVEGR